MAVCNDSTVAVLPNQPSGNSSGVSAVSAIGAGGERRTAVFAIAPAAGSSPQKDIGPLVTHNRPVFTADVAASSTFASAHFGTATISSYSTPSTVRCAAPSSGARQSDVKRRAAVPVRRQRA